MTSKPYGKPVPNDWDGQEYTKFWGTVPNSPLWRGYVRGAVFELTERWDETTGNAVVAADTGGEVFDSLQMGEMEIGVTDHGELAGLTDDDHPQYLNNARGDARYSQLSHSHDHGELTGLTDDDHPQYLNNARGDARYSQLGHNHQNHWIYAYGSQTMTPAYNTGSPQKVSLAGGYGPGYVDVIAGEVEVLEGSINSSYLYGQMTVLSPSDTWVNAHIRVNGNDVRVSGSFVKGGGIWQTIPLVRIPLTVYNGDFIALWINVGVNGVKVVNVPPYTTLQKDSIYAVGVG